MRLFPRGAVSLFLVSLCAFSFATDYPLTVTDGLGHEITLTKAPERIASLTLFTDEVLLDMVDASRLSHMTNLASDPTFSNIADRVPVSAKQTELNVEVLVSDFPDIIFAANWSDAAVVEQLKSAGLSVYLVNTPFSMNGIVAAITELGLIVDAESSAQRIVSDMDTKLKTALQQINYAPRTVLDYSTWGASSGKDSTFNAVMTSAGLVNSAAALEAGPYGQVPMSKELLVEIDPEVIFLPGFVWGDPEGAANFRQQVETDAALTDVNALQNGRIIMLPEHLRGTYSQYIADTVLFVVDQVNGLK
jgi:iron complex transport system substrate-binding protein